MQFKPVFEMTDGGDRCDTGFAALIELQSLATGTLENPDDRLLQKIWVTAKEFMLLNERQFCEMAGTRPAVQVYGSHMTPLLLKFTHFLLCHCGVEQVCSMRYTSSCG